MDISGITERPLLQGTGVVLFRKGEPVANLIQCMDGQHWSVRVAGAGFETGMGERLLSGRTHGDLAYADGEAAARQLALDTLRRQRRHLALPAMHRTGTRAA